MDVITNFKKQIAKIEDNKIYTPKDILEMGVVIDTNLKPSIFTVYRLIKSGKLKAVDLGTGSVAKYKVKGKDLKKFLCERYQLEEVRQ